MNKECCDAFVILHPFLNRASTARFQEAWEFLYTGTLWRLARACRGGAPAFPGYQRDFASWHRSGGYVVIPAEAGIQ